MGLGNETLVSFYFLLAFTYKWDVKTMCIQSVPNAYM